MINSGDVVQPWNKTKQIKHCIGLRRWEKTLKGTFTTKYTFLQRSYQQFRFYFDNSLKMVWAGRAYSPQPAGQPRGARRQVCEYFNRRRDTNRQKIINTNIPRARAAKNNQHMKVAIDDRQYGYQTVANVLEYVKTGKDKKIRQPH